MAQPGPKPRNAYGRTKHLKDLEKFAEELSTIVNKQLPSYEKPYGQVAVLAFHWENDDLGVAPLEAELLDVFRKIYGFNVESFTIPPASNATIDLLEKLVKFYRKWDAKDALTIYIYSGHAEEADQAGYQYMLGGQTDNSGRIIGPKINWFQMRGGPESAVGDVLYIFDACFAASAAIYDGPEVLAAVSWGDVAAANLRTSFTRMLIDKLKALRGASQTVALIYSSIHQGAISNKLERGPVHIPKKGKESIVLAKIYGSKQRKPESFTERQSRIEDNDPSEYRVLISVNLQDDIHTPNVDQWENWLTANIPSHILSSNITIEAHFQGSSSLLLVTLPIEVWTMLPADEEAYGFISFVNSNIFPFRPALPVPKPAPVPVSGATLVS